MIEEVNLDSWAPQVTKNEHQNFLNTIEEGGLLFFPNLPFSLRAAEHKFLTPDCADPKSKNISYNSQTSQIRGCLWEGNDLVDLKNMMDRFVQQARSLVDSLLPHYQPNVIWGRTSFRPVETMGRQASSYRKDDSRLHVDAFASTPVQGQRLLRVFTNINPNDPRVWKIGEPFEDVAKRFLPLVSKHQWISPHILKAVGVTKGLRTAYDHIMLQLHNSMKHDMQYQKSVANQEVSFPSGSTWIVMTDKVSHAALSGQFMLEQTFYLAPEAMQSPEKSPLHILERLTGKRLMNQ
jgi:hypothetical protein